MAKAIRTPLVYKPQARVAVKRQGMRRLGALAFWLFLLAQLFSLIRIYLFEVFDQQLLAPWATVAGVGSLVLLPVSVFGYGEYAGDVFGYIRRGVRVWLVLFFVWITLTALYGWQIKDYMINAVLQDYGPYLILLTCVILGSIPEFWDDIFPALLLVTAIGVVVNILGFQNFNDLIMQFGVHGRFFGEVTAYETRTALHFWPLLLLTVGRWQRRFPIFLVYAITTISLAMQILFQKRLETVVALAFIGIFGFIVPHFATHWETVDDSRTARRLRNRFLILVFVMSVGALLVAPEIVTGQTSAWLRRYEQRDTSRINEAIGMLDYMQDYEYLIGRGMGGYFEYTDEYGVWGEYMVDAGVIGRRQLHMGVFMPLFKGGMILMLLYYTLVWLTLRSARKYTRDLLSLACFSIIVVMTLQSLQGAMMVMVASYNIIMMGLCFGRCLAFQPALILSPSETR